MRPGASKVAATKNSKTITVFEDKKTRKSLHPLQPAATNKENLVGAGRQLRSSLSGKNTKNEMNEKTTKNNVEKKATEKNVAEKNESSKKNKEKVKVDTKKKSNTKTTTKRSFKTQSSQTEAKYIEAITAEELTSEVEPSENYWKVLAERRRIALQDALEENDTLTEQVKIYKEMLDESRALVEVLKEMLGDDGNSINNSLEDRY